MTPRIITYFLCGMRHPTTGLSEDDLSRLTGSSSSTASCCSNGSSSSSSPSTSPLHKELQQQKQQEQSPNVSIVATATRDEDNHQLTTAPTSTSSNITTDAELLKNLKNTSTHLNIQQGNSGNGNGNGSGNNTKAGSHFNSSYLPEFIDPLDWQKSRKRKERLDSTSSTTQDRKLIRSNSEELLPNDDNGVDQHATKNNDELTTTAKSAALKLKQHADTIRRVASEDFKKSPYCLFDLRAESADSAVLDPAANEAATINGSDENNAFAANRQQQQQQYDPLPPAYSETLVSGPTKDMTRRSRFETSPARSNRHSPSRNGNSKHHRDSDDSECEHERRRSSERFCKSRAPPGRKAAGVMKKSGKYLPTKMRGDENTYKYDLSALKYERRGFTSKKPNAAERSNGSDYNDNNLIDFHIIRNGSETPQVASAIKPQPTAADTQSAVPSQSSNNATNAVNSTSSNNSNSNSNSNINKVSITSAEALPWDSSTAADQTEPILSRRYATVRHRPSDCIDTAAKLSKVMPYPQQFHKQTATQLMDDDDCIEPMNAFRAFASLENLKTRDVMQQVIPAMMSFQSPEERLKQVNKRLTALKKKLGQFEQVFETKMGYRPSQVEKLNDKYMKNVLAEIGKLRKEKHDLKMNPMGGGALGIKISGGMDATKKLEKMKTSLNEIEQNLSDKRQDSNRSETLDELTADQLLQEKTAVQHGLLYFESLYGRPSTKDERDAARPIYDRYRQLKRMVSRSVTLAGAAAGAPELPTILEHEAMVFESTPQLYSSNTSTESSNNTATSDTLTNTPTASDDSTTTTTGNVEASSAASSAAQPTSQSMSGENISALSIEQLWEQLDKTCEEKKMLRRTIREYETVFEEQNGRKMLKSDRKNIEETYALYKEKKAKTRLLQALIKKHVSR